KTLRERWPDDRLYVVLDNFSPHKHAQVRAWAAANDVDLVFTPTYTSWLNWIESEFAALRYFALGGTDRRSHNEQNTAIAGYIRWRNHRCGPKTGFAIDSPIRTRPRPPETTPTNHAPPQRAAPHPTSSVPEEQPAPPSQPRPLVGCPPVFVLHTFGDTPSRALDIGDRVPVVIRSPGEIRTRRVHQHADPDARRGRLVGADRQTRHGIAHLHTHTEDRQRPAQITEQPQLRILTDLTQRPDPLSWKQDRRRWGHDRHRRMP
ncbi:MAG: hypothetical protein JWN52_5706, partial [Actinomycetia bacterium]|nr:hypothetical protein [Actinomycetes bacterium]